jgi:hypothetical protein
VGRHFKTPPPLPDRPPTVADVTPALMRAWRLAHAYTLQELAEHAGLTLRQLSVWETGKVTPSPAYRLLVWECWTVGLAALAQHRPESSQALAESPLPGEKQQS